MAVAFSSLVVAETVDVVSSASVENYYGDLGLEGKELAEAVNSFSGFYTISTTNEDETPNSAFVIFAMVENNEKYYLQFGLAESQTLVNLNRTGEGVAMYASTPLEGEDAPPYATVGARIRFKVVTDETVLATIAQGAAAGTVFAEIVQVLPLG